MIDLVDTLEQIRSGTAASELEGPELDFKTVGRSTSDALVDLAQAAACFANSAGGTIIVGVKDSPGGPDAFIGCELDPVRTVARIYELTNPALNVIAEAEQFDGTHLLVIHVPASPEIHQVKGIATERIGSSCHPMPASRIATLLQDRRGDDWSAKDSGKSPDDASPIAVEIARDLLRASTDGERRSWAEASWPDLCRRLGILIDGRLTNGGRSLFVDDGAPHVQYTHRVSTAGLLGANEQISGSGLWALQRTLEMIDARIQRTAIVIPGGAQLLIGELPDGAVREAVVNAFMHRDYRQALPVQVEQTEQQLRLTSPGGFVPGVTVDNILTTPSRSRNPSLVQALRSLSLGEAAGVGVDRMYSAMTSVGHAPPQFSTDGFTVTINLFGGPPNEPFARYVSGMPANRRHDPDTLLVLRHLLEQRTTTAQKMAPILQKSKDEAEAILMGLSAPGSALIERTADSAHSRSGEYRLTGDAIRELGPAVRYRTRSGDDTARKITEMVREAGVITGRMVQTMFDIKPTSASRILSDLVDRRILVKTSTASRGPSVTYGPGDAFPTSNRRASRGRDNGNPAQPTLDDVDVQGE